MTIPRLRQFNCFFAAALVTIAPQAPSSFLNSAKKQITVESKIGALRKLIQSFPLDPQSEIARDHLVSLLLGSNRFEEALQTYEATHSRVGVGEATDFKLLDYLLKTGHYNEVLHATSITFGRNRDLIREMKIAEVRVQALLAQGQYRTARQCVDAWLLVYAADGEAGTRFEIEVKIFKYLKQNLQTLERTQGIQGKPLFTASVPDSLQHWSQQQNVPIYFFKLVPAHAGGQMPRSLVAGASQPESAFQSIVDSLNHGFEHLSQGNFSLAFKGVDTLYIKEGDFDPAMRDHLLTSRVYMHTIPELYKLAGQAFVVLVDYREESEDEAAYMGDGLIHLSATKLQPMVIMHEILHGLGATHRDWAYLESQGYRFDPDDRGLMTFEHGEILNMGLEEKNRALLGWPQVSVLRLNAVDVAELPAPLPEPTVTASLPKNTTIY